MEAVASTLATPFAQPIIAASKSKVKNNVGTDSISQYLDLLLRRLLRENRKTEDNATTYYAKLLLAIVSNSLETTTTSPSCSGEESNNFQTRIQRQHVHQQSITTAD